MKKLYIILIALPFIVIGQDYAPQTINNNVEDYKEYWENGKLRVEGNVSDDKKEGLWKWYHKNGRYDEVTFKEGKLISEKCWDENGNEIDCK